MIFSLAACGSGQQAEPDTTTYSEAAKENVPESDMPNPSTDSTSEPDNRDVSDETQNDMEENMRLFIGDTEVSVKWEDNESVGALAELVKKEPLVIDMSMYGGFEQIGSIGADLPRNDKQTTTQSGDVVLYSGKQIVIFHTITLSI